MGREIGRGRESDRAGPMILVDEFFAAWRKDSKYGGGFPGDRSPELAWPEPPVTRENPSARRYRAS
jgi:hypothetical protein